MQTYATTFFNRYFLFDILYISIVAWFINNRNKRNNIKLKITSMENDKLINYPQENNSFSAIRVSLVQDGCFGPFLGLSFDQEKPQDESFQIHELTFIMEKSLLKKCGGISIDFNEAGSFSGFTITSVNPLSLGEECCSPGPCGSCGCCQ
ncbi:IscA/HesB family protein [Desulforhopalus sp. IMCC35007]|uniref:IscA/HesB family protein n=1 Tax=Desulforhopalus sp. IMCC35007 TaxID=2569543 RepID=UPI00197AF4B5